MPRGNKKEEIVEAVVVEKKKTVKEEVSSSKKDNQVKIETNKPYFFPRLMAYVIDILLVSVVCSLILMVIPQNANYDKYMKEYEKIQTDFLQENIEAEEYIEKSASVIYDIDYSNTLNMILEVTLIILYFVVFQFYNKGQTFGKRLMKIRLVSVEDQPLTLTQVACRSLIINSVLIDMFVIGALLFLGRNYYYYVSSSLQMISFIVIFITLMMILFRKDGRGLHDVVTKTKVIQEN